MKNAKVNMMSEETSVPKEPKLGERLKRAREAKHMRINHISDQLLIAEDVVSRIESDSYQLNDLTVFLRGYIRHYARLMEIPLSEVNQHFETLGWQSIKPPKTTIIAKTNPTSTAKQKRGGKIEATIGLVLVLAFLALALCWHGFRYQRDMTLKNNNQSVAVLAQKESTKPVLGELNAHPESIVESSDSLLPASVVSHDETAEPSVPLIDATVQNASKEKEEAIASISKENPSPVQVPDTAAEVSVPEITTEQSDQSATDLSELNEDDTSGTELESEPEEVFDLPWRKTDE
jgi:cytoskeleton protein RodZ